MLDDVADPQDLVGLWPPDTVSGRTVITTRRRDSALLDGRHLVDVSVFTPAEAEAYLNGRLGDGSRRLDESRQLAEDLGFLPLALAQAAAYIRDQDLTCASYRQRLRRRSLNRLHPAALPDGQQRAVADIWGLSIELADKQAAGLASVVLDMAAILDPNGIPASLFATDAALDYYRDRLDRDVDDDDAWDALRTLYRLGLADTARDTEVDSGLVRVHALVQRVVGETISDDRRPRVAHAAADALLELWPDVRRNARTARLGRQLGANTAALTVSAGDYLWQNRTGEPNAHAIMFRAGSSQGLMGLLTAAYDYFEQLLTDCMTVLGPDHPSTLAARNDRAYWQGRTGDAVGASAAYEQLLADRIRLLGPDHPETLATRDEVAWWRGVAGDVAGASKAYEQLLADRIRILGPDHPDTLTTRENVAWWLGEAGDALSVREAYEQLLADRARLLGPDHPDTLTTRNRLASWRGNFGDIAGASEAYELLLADRMRIFGPDHPETLAARNDVAWWRGRTGDGTGATKAYEQLVADRTRILGAEDPGTLATRNRLAWWRGRTGDFAGATEAYEQLLADRTRLLGPDHLDTMATRDDLAWWRGEAGDAVGAMKGFEQLLADRIRILGPDHPDTLTTRGDLAWWRSEAGDVAGAMKAYEQLLADRIRILGPDHPETLATRNRLASGRG